MRTPSARTAEPTVTARMTRGAIAIPLGASYYDIAAALVTSRLGVLPVLDDTGRLAGVVSMRDLVRAIPRARGRTARDLMTGAPVTVPPDMPVSTAARVLDVARARRAFVVEDGRVLGVLSRRDLLRGKQNDVRADDDIRAQVERTVCAGLPDDAVRARVEDGVVFLSGRVEWRSDHAGIGSRARTVPGVVEVHNHCRYVWDDGPTTVAPGRRPVRTGVPFYGGQ